MDIKPLGTDPPIPDGDAVVRHAMVDAVAAVLAFHQVANRSSYSREIFPELQA
jgi:hypothetical protein